MSAYKPLVQIKSIFLGQKREYECDITQSEIPLEQEFWKDNDIQYMKVISTNYGLQKEYTKQYDRKAK